MGLGIYIHIPFCESRCNYCHFVTRPWQAATAEEKELLQKAGAEALVSTDSNRFRVDPRQSYVPKETREKDREFWMPK